MQVRRILAFYIVGMMAFVMSSCDSEESGNLNLIFKLNYGGEPLVMFDQKKYPTETFDLFFSRFSFYMSELSTMGPNANVINEISFINPTSDHLDLNSAENGYSIKISDIPSGTYEGLKFGIGVPSDLNALSPSDFSNDHPLSESGEYWLGWESYVFLKIEGKFDPDGDGEFDRGISLHIGSDAAYKNVEIDRSFEIIDGESTDFVIHIDLQDAFINNGAIYDLEGTSHIHSLEQMDFAQQLLTNIVSGLEN